MDRQHHKFSDLFAQLGLPSDNEGIGAFIGDHSPLGAGLRLDEAPFWTSAQSTLLREELVDDADWAEVIDRLNLALRRD